MTSVWVSGIQVSALSARLTPAALDSRLCREFPPDFPAAGVTLGAVAFQTRGSKSKHATSNPTRSLRR